MKWNGAEGLSLFTCRGWCYVVLCSLGLGALLVVLLLISGMLGSFHGWLGVTNQTTWQMVQMQRNEHQMHSRRRRRWDDGKQENTDGDTKVEGIEGSTQLHTEPRRPVCIDVSR